jgi:tetratricopeptide (TPR) repeat protein
MGMYEEAVMKFQAAIGLDPGYALSHGNLAEAYVGLEEYEMAREELEKAVELDSGNMEYRRALAEIEDR